MHIPKPLGRLFASAAAAVGLPQELPVPDADAAAPQHESVIADPVGASGLVSTWEEGHLAGQHAEMQIYPCSLCFGSRTSTTLAHATDEDRMTLWTAARLRDGWYELLGDPGIRETVQVINSWDGLPFWADSTPGAQLAADIKFDYPQGASVRPVAAP